MAAQTGNAEATIFLINKGANVNQPDNYGNIPLHLVKGQYRSTVAQYLLAAGSNINSENRDSETPLCLAIKQGYLDLIDILLDNGPVENRSTFY